MDNTKIHDSQLQHLEHSGKKSLQNILGSVSGKNSVKRLSQLKENRKIVPRFNFTFTEYKIKDYVQYTVNLHESYFVLGRQISHKYSFLTRYSLLEKLSNELGSQGFPPKRFFGNRKEKVIKERMCQLQNYLNAHTRRPSKMLLKFIHQIKQHSHDNQLNKSLKL